MISLINFVSKNCRNGVGIFCKNLRIQRIIHRSSVSLPPAKSTGPKMLIKLRERDVMPENYILIYRSSMQTTIYMFYPLSILSLVLIISTYYMFRGREDDAFFQRDAGVAPIAFENRTQFDIVFGTYLIMNILSLYYLKRAVLRIWHNPDTNDYRMVLLGLLPPKFTKQVSFKSGELTRKALDPTNSWQEYWHKFRGGYVFLTSREFPNAQSYYDMVGRKFRGGDY